MSYDANAALRHALGVAIPTLRHDQVDSAIVRLLAHPSFVESIILALEEANWSPEDAIRIAIELRAFLTAPSTTVNFDPHAGMETR